MNYSLHCCFTLVVPHRLTSMSKLSNTSLKGVRKSRRPLSTWKGAAKVEAAASPEPELALVYT